MKKQHFAVLFTLTCVLALALVARAQDEETVVANVPYDFVAGGAVLPAGTYRVSRVETGGGRELRISSYDTGGSAFLIPTGFAHAPGGHAQLSLQEAGGRYFLSKIQTASGVYTLALPRSAITLVQKEQHGRMSASGSN